MTDLCLGRCAGCYDANHCSCKCHDGKRTESRGLDWDAIIKRAFAAAAEVKVVAG